MTEKTNSEVSNELGLARFDRTEDRLQADMERALTDKLLAQTDVGSEIMRDLEVSASLSLPTLADIERSLSPEVKTPESREEIEGLLSLEKVGDISIEGMRLNDLLGRAGGASLEERSILKRGLLFLKRRMYPEALEWWTLNRPKDFIEKNHFYCLLTLLMGLTYRLSGDDESASAMAQEARARLRHSG